MISIDEIRNMFEDNFEELKFESGRSIAPHMKEFAWQQIKLYYEKLEYIASKVTETEAKLILPNQTTPKGKNYTIHGVVDIVHEENSIVMYDIKTHKSEDVKANKDLYKAQLNVYAHMWKNLRNSEIDNIAIIATSPPDDLKTAIYENDKSKIEKLMGQWNPLVDLYFDEEDVTNQIMSFGEIVDKIEDGRFEAPSVDKLKDIVNGQKMPFGTAVCRHCDARYSCSSYNEYKCRAKLDKDIIDKVKKEDEIEKEAWKDGYLQ